MLVLRLRTDGGQRVRQRRRAAIVCLSLGNNVVKSSYMEQRSDDRVARSLSVSSLLSLSLIHVHLVYVRAPRSLLKTAHTSAAFN